MSIVLVGLNEALPETDRQGATITLTMFQSHRGFTLIELLVVIAIIGVLATVVVMATAHVQARGRDSERVQSMIAFSKGLDLYHLEHGKYPAHAGGSGLWGFQYRQLRSDGTCSGSISLRFDNSVSPGFLSVLYDEGLVNISDWNDPRNPDDLEENSPHNCRYVVLRDELLANNVQHYLLHCKLEADSKLEANDGGTNDEIFEIQRPEPWVCITVVPTL